MERRDPPLLLLPIKVGTQVDPRIFETLREIIHRESGICLTFEKKSLLENRLGKRLRALNLKDEKEYLSYLRSDEVGQELVELLDAVSTNTTYFYREPDHFEFLSKILPTFAAAGRIRIWCAASSTGEEPYTLAMTCRETLESDVSLCRILATDICTRVLRVAQQGSYERKQVEGIPQHLLQECFKRTADGRFQASSELRDMISFRKLNLAQFPFPLKEGLDLIFCRNVMIYFDRDLRERIVKEFIRLLRPGGYLVIGHSENLMGFSTGLRSVQPSVYMKPLGS